MFEVSLFILVILAIAAFAFLPLGSLFCKSSGHSASKACHHCADDASQSAADFKLTIPEDSTLRRHFLTHLRSEIESTLSPRPTDSILQRHYDAMVAAELESRLAAMAE